MIVAYEKRDTSGGFAPSVPHAPEIVRPSIHALRLDGELNQSTLSPALHRLLLDMARIKNVVSSLRLENKDIDLERGRKAVEAGKSDDPSERQVLRFAEKYAWIHETPRKELPEPSTGLVLEWHEELLTGDPEIPPGSLGRFKTKPNQIEDRTTGSPVFYPTPPERTQEELEALFGWYRLVRDRELPGVVAALFFAEFEAIHPFEDGNGRLGRILTLLVLKQCGLENAALVPLDGRFFHTADKYYEKLASTNDGKNWHIWTRYFVHQLERAYDLAVRRADLRPLVEDQSSQVTRRVLEWVLGGSETWFQRSDITNAEGYSPASLTNALASLVDQGILEAKGEKRGRRYRIATSFLERAYGGIHSED